MAGCRGSASAELCADSQVDPVALNEVRIFLQEHEARRVSSFEQPLLLGPDRSRLRYALIVCPTSIDAAHLFFCSSKKTAPRGGRQEDSMEGCG